MERLQRVTAHLVVKGDSGEKALETINSLLKREELVDFFVLEHKGELKK